MSDDAAWLELFLGALTRASPPAVTPPLGPQPGAPPAAAAQGGAASGALPAALVRDPPIQIAAVLPTAATAKLAITPALLRQLGAADADAWAPILAAACAAHAITTPRRQAAFLANILVETGGLARLTESLNYRADVLLKQWPKRFTAASAQRLGRTAAHPADQRGIAEAAYGGRLGNGPSGSGDGWLFRGRGLIQLTGRDNYARFAAKLGMPLADLPAFLETRPGAAQSAASFWERVGCNTIAENGDIRAVRRLVNGGEIGLDHVREKYHAACRALGVAA